MQNSTSNPFHSNKRQMYNEKYDVPPHTDGWTSDQLYGQAKPKQQLNPLTKPEKAESQKLWYVKENQWDHGKL